MKKTSLKGLDLDIFTEKLDNGLEVIFIPYTDKKNYFITYATRYGSTVTKFKPVGSKRMVSVPTGIAHFLEHKMFEQEDGVDPFTFISMSGTGANASTSFDSTQYICYGTKNFKENFDFLIKYVNSPYFTAENVEKEKGIIIEELKMYLDIPDYRLENKLKESVYKTHPRRIDIGGTISDVESITKEDLYKCYDSFYVPNNMFIIVAGNFDKDEAISIVKDNLKDKKKVKLPEIKEVKEQISVNKKMDSFEADINVSKLAFGLKIPTTSLSIKNDLELDLYLSMFISIVFGISSEFREKLRNKKLINNFYTELEKIKDFRVFNIMASTENIDELIKDIKYELKNIKTDKDTFERIKKVWIANEVRITDNVDATVGNIYDDMIKYNKVITNRVELIRKMDFKKLNKLLTEIDFNNYSIVKLNVKDAK
ncbi:MAG: insulinase family protein [Bacilli bacterium]|nr:insulinase family protein [Bacilli bacterium]